MQLTEQPQVSTEQLVDMAETLLSGRHSLVEYRRILLQNNPATECPAAPFHRRWSDDLLKGLDHFAVEAFRESAKTQYVIRAYLLHALSFPRKDCSYIVILKANETLAANKLREVIVEYTTNSTINTNLVEIKEKSGNAFVVRAQTIDGEEIEVRIEAYGKGASIRGLSNKDKRPDIVIGDDLQDLEDMKSPTTLDNDWEWFLGDVWFLGQHTRLFIIGNNLGEACIIERIFTNSDQLGFKAYKIPKHMPNGASSWQDKFPVDDILTEKERFRQIGQLDIWLRECQCEAASEETRVFKTGDFQWFSQDTTPKLIEGCNIYMTLDPASSKSQDSCYRAIVVNAVNADNYWFIVDVPYGRWDSVELMKILFEKVQQWKPKTVGIEKGMYHQVIEPFLKEHMVRENVFFNITEVEHMTVGSKLERVSMLAPRFRCHSVWFPHEAQWATELLAELRGVTKEGFKSLYTDLADALAMQEQIAKPPFGKKKTNTLRQEAQLERGNE
jgi:predicted phage terminase large subunit-like protein